MFIYIPTFLYLNFPCNIFFKGNRIFPHYMYEYMYFVCSAGVGAHHERSEAISIDGFDTVWRKIEITGFGTFFCFNFKFNLSFCFYHNVELILRKNSLKRDFFEVKLGRKLPDAKTSIQKGNIWYIFGKN